MRGLIIQERMAGHISFQGDHGPLQAGVKYPFDFNIRAFNSKMGYPLPFYFHGKAYTPGMPMGPEHTWPMIYPAVEGTMQISHRGVAYDFHTELLHLGRVRIHGAKQYRYTMHWPTVRASLVTLPLTIEKDGVIIGHGEMLYREPLWKFTFGLRYLESQYAFAPRRRLAHRTLPIARALVPEIERYVDEDTFERNMERQFEAANWFIYTGQWWGHYLLRLWSWLKYRCSVNELSREQQNSFARDLSRYHLLHLLSLPLVTMILGAVFDSDQFRALSGQHLPQIPKRREDEPWRSLNMLPTDQFSKEDLEVDVVVVGSGAGGAPVAYELARKGHAVAVVEEGHYFSRLDMTGKRIDMFEKLYRNAGLSFTLSSAPLWIPTGRGVGGTTAINSGTCIRTPESVQERWRQELELHDVDLNPYFPQVEQMLDVKPIDDQYVGGIKSVIAKGLEGTDLKLKVLLRDETGCDGQSYCTLGCPTEAKRSTNVSYLPAAMKNNAHVFTHYKVQKVLVEQGRAVGVLAQLPGFGPEFSIRIRAKKVVVAAGAFQTPQLLKDSGLTRDNRQVGEHLTVHPALNLGALFDYPVWQQRFVPQSLGVFGQKHDDYILEGYTLPADSMPPAFQSYGDDLSQVLDNFKHFTNFAAMLKDHAEGRLHMTRWGVLPEYFINPQTQKVLKRAAIDLGQIFFRAGAKYIYAPISGREKMDRVQFEQHFINEYVSAHRYTLSAHHPLGTCRMSGHASSGALDSECRLRGVKDLFVCDGSAIPGPLGVNPQITIMSNALRVANIIHGELT